MSAFSRFFQRFDCGRKVFRFRFGATQFPFELFLFFFHFLVLAQGGGMFGGLLRDIRGEIRAVGGAARLQFGNLLRAEPGGVLGLRFLSGLGFLFGIFFFEDGAADNGIGLCLGGGFFVLGFHEIGSQSGDLILV